MARSFIKVAGAFNRQGYDTNLAMAIAFKMTVIYQFPVEVRDTLYNIGAQAFMGPNVNNVKKLKNFVTQLFCGQLTAFNKLPPSYLTSFRPTHRKVVASACSAWMKTKRPCSATMATLPTL